MNWFFAAAALALLLWFFALLYLKSFVRKRTSPDHILGLLQEEVRQLEADIDEKTERDLELLEEKIRALREICAEIDRRIAVYDRELERRGKEAQTMAALERGRSALNPPKKNAKQSGNIELVGYTRPAGYEPLKIIVSRDSPVDNQPANKQPVAKQPVVKLPPLKERIAELYKAGFAPELIAKQLELTLGEVTLYINMIKKALLTGKQKKKR